MPSTYTDNLRLENQATGENDGTWGDKADTIFALLEEALTAETSISTTGGDTTLTTNNGATDQARAMFLDVGGTLTSNANIIIPAVNKIYLVRNATSGSYTVTVKVSGQTGAEITQGRSVTVYCDGTNTFAIGSEAVTITSAAASILDDTSTGAILTTLGFSSWAQTNLIGAADEATFKSNVNLEIGTDVQAYDADILKADTSDDLAVGYTSTSSDQGTKTTGTFTPTFATRNIQRYINGGAHTLAPPSSGEGTMVIQITNNGSAGAITTSGFTIVTGDSFTTTNGHDFMCYISVVNSFSHLNVVALQ